MLRLELVLPSGLVIRSRMSKEDYSRMGLHDDQTVSIHIKTYRILSKQNELGSEVSAVYDLEPKGESSHASKP
jgi:hypothetical protein